jgi:hypothetical protein
LAIGVAAPHLSHRVSGVVASCVEGLKSKLQLGWTKSFISEQLFLVTPGGHLAIGAATPHLAHRVCVCPKGAVMQMNASAMQPIIDALIIVLIFLPPYYVLFGLFI